MVLPFAGWTTTSADATDTQQFVVAVRGRTTISADATDNRCLTFISVAGRRDSGLDQLEHLAASGMHLVWWHWLFRLSWKLASSAGNFSKTAS